MIEFALFLQFLLFVVVCVALYFARATFSFFHPIAFYLGFHFVVFVLRPIMVYCLGFDGRWIYMHYFPTEAEFIDTLWASTAGMFVFVAACWFAGRAQMRFSPHGLPPLTLEERRGFNLMLFLLAPFAIYSGFFASAGTTFEGTGDVQMTIDVATGIPVFVNTTGYIVQAHAMLGAMCLLFLWRHRFRLWAYGPLLVFISYRAFLGWGRWAIITTLLSLALLQLYRSKARWFKARYLIVAIPVFLLFQNLGLDRNLVRDYVEGQASLEMTEYRDSGSYIDSLDQPDFANFEFLAFVLWVVPGRSRTYTYFTQYLQLFTEPIPRILWSEKPVGSPVQLINLNDHGNFVGLTTSLVGDGWMSLGWIGVIVTMALCGLVLGRIHVWFWRHQGNARVILVYCLFLPLCIQWFRDGGISIAKFSLFSLFPVLVWIAMTKLTIAMKRRQTGIGAGLVHPGGGPRRMR